MPGDEIENLVDGAGLFPGVVVAAVHGGDDVSSIQDRKSTRLNSSHVSTSYAVFCLKKKTHQSSDNLWHSPVCHLHFFCIVHGIVLSMKFKCTRRQAILLRVYPLLPPPFTLVRVLFS